MSQKNLSSKGLTRRTFLKGALGAGAFALMNSPYGVLIRALAQAPDEANWDPSIWPGSPYTPGGWTTALPDVPEGFPLAEPIRITANVLYNADAEFVGGDTMDNNPFTRLSKELFNIEWQSTWKVRGDDAVQKLQLAIASDDLPDVMEWVPLDSFKQMLDAGMLLDVTDAWEEFASPALKEMTDGNGGIAWDYVTVDGRRFGIPIVERAAQNDKVMFIRQDWLDTVGMSVPTTLDEMAEVMRAFREAGLGGDSYIGLNASNQLNTWVTSLDPIFGAFGVMPSPNGGSIQGVWREDANGDLMYDSLRPEMKDALALLRDWYSEGLLRQDFFTVNQSDSVAAMSANQTGINFAPSWHVGWGVSGSVGNDPDAVWTWAPVPAGTDGTRGLMWSNPYRETMYCFRQDFAHIEAYIKYINWLQELYEPERRMHGWEGYNYTLTDEVFAETDLQQEWFRWTFAHSGFDVQQWYKENLLFMQWAELPEDQLDAHQKWRIQEGGGNALMQIAAYNHAAEMSDTLGIKNLFRTLPTPTMQTAGATLASLESQTFLGIITGQQPLEMFDEFVNQWTSLGGSDITSEVNAWWHSRS